MTPQLRDGQTMLPRTSVPMENPTSPAAVAAAEPAEEPPVPRSGFQGFLVWPPNQTSPPTPPFDSLATSTAPASSRRAATVGLCERT